MTNQPERPIRRRWLRRVLAGAAADETPAGWLRVGLLQYLGVTALVGGWAALWPRSFYDDFPWPGHPWVALLPGYNEHLVRDFGAMNLAMAVVFGVAATTLDRRLATTALVAYLVFALPHLLPPAAPGAVRHRRRGRPGGDARGRGGPAAAPARPRPPRARSSST